MVAFDPTDGAGNLIKADCGRLPLTMPSGGAILAPAGTSSTGSRNLVNIGEKSPQSLAAFLCTSLFSATLLRLFTMTGCFGQVSHLAVPMYGFRPHYSPSPDSVETISGGLPIRYIGMPK